MKKITTYLFLLISFILIGTMEKIVELPGVIPFFIELFKIASFSIVILIILYLILKIRYQIKVQKKRHHK